MYNGEFIVNWYAQLMESKMRGKDAEQYAAQRQWLREAAVNDKRQNLPIRILLTIGCWLVECAWNLQRQRGSAVSDILRWRNLEVRHTISLLDPRVWTSHD
jgi:hypothetical protein